MSIFGRLFGNDKEKEDDGLTRDFSFGPAKNQELTDSLPAETNFGLPTVGGGNYTSYSGYDRASFGKNVSEFIANKQKNAGIEPTYLTDTEIKKSLGISNAALQGASGSGMIENSNENFISGLQENNTSIPKKSFTGKRTMSGFEPVREKETPTPNNQINIGPLPEVKPSNLKDMRNKFKDPEFPEIEIPQVSALPEIKQRGLDYESLKNVPMKTTIQTSEGPQEIQYSTIGQEQDMKNFLKNEGIKNEDGSTTPVVDMGLYSTESSKIKTAKDGKEIKMVGIGEVAQFTGKGLETEIAYKGYIPESQLETYNQIKEQKELQQQVDEERAAGIFSRVIRDENGNPRIVYPTRRGGLPQTDSGTGVVQGGLLKGENVSSSIGQTLRGRAGDVSMKANRNRTNTVAQEALDLFTAAGINPDVDFNASDNVAILNALDSMGSINQSKSDQGRAALNLIINNTVADRERIIDQTERTEERTAEVTARNEQIDAEFENLAKRVASGDADQNEIDTFYETTENNISLDKTLNPDQAATDKLTLFGSYATTMDKILESLQADFDAATDVDTKKTITNQMEKIRKNLLERSTETNEFLKGLNKQTIEKIKAKAKVDSDLTEQDQRNFQQGVRGVVQFLSSSNAEEIDGVIESLQDPLYKKALNSPLYIAEKINIEKRISNAIKNNKNITKEQRLKLGNTLFFTNEQVGLKAKDNKNISVLDRFLNYDGENKKEIEKLNFYEIQKNIDNLENLDVKKDAQRFYDQGNYKALRALSTSNKILAKK